MLPILRLVRQHTEAMAAHVHAEEVHAFDEQGTMSIAQFTMQPCIIFATGISQLCSPAIPATHLLGQPKICDLDAGDVARLGQQQVLQLEVAVHHIPAGGKAGVA